MAKLNLDYYIGKDLYSDGDVENEILEIAGNGGLTEDMENVSFPVLYHLSPVRENILNWYPFKEGAVGLEIGSGCGAITRLLCEKLSRVVSVELSRRRAEINYVRNKEIANLEIRVGNLNDMEFEEPFDYVILNGVFEYAMGFTAGEQPYETFLKKVAGFLKPNGILLIAIENRLGLKYFAGAPEDHTDGYFDGIRGYRGNQSVRTFSRGEWEKLMCSCGLNQYRFYYPYPDYKFPKEIFTDESLKEQRYGCPGWNFTKYRMSLFEEAKMAETLQQEGIMGHFANSFLIEMSRGALDQKQKIIYAKLSTDRSEEYAVATVIREKTEAGSGMQVREVLKTPVTQKARAHLNRMLERQERISDHGSWQELPVTEEKDGILSPFLGQGSLGRKAEQALEKGETEKIHQWITCVQELIRQENGQHLCAQDMTASQKAEFAAVFGDSDIPEDADCVSPANIDLILDNIFETEEGTFCVIDCEWIFEFPVPASFILWRCINEFYSRNPRLEQICSGREMYQRYGITAEDEARYHRWATFFAERYVGANRLLRCSIPEVGVSLDEFRERMRMAERMSSQLFVDTGKGFSEEEKITVETELADGHFSVSFDLSGFSGIRALRFDPLEGSPCICRIAEEGTTGKLCAANAAAKEEQGDLFLTRDPVYHISGWTGQEKLSICGTITVLSMEEALERGGRLLQKRSSRFSFWKK